MRLGWSLQDRTGTTMVETGKSFQVHEAILKVATVFLGA